MSKYKKVKIDSEGKFENKYNNILVIVLKEGKGSRWKWIKDNNDKFDIDGHTYFIVDDGTHLNINMRFSVYLEGVSTPIHHGYIEKQKIIKEIPDINNPSKKIKQTIFKIKGLKFDSKLTDILLNRHLADEFTKEHLDMPNILLAILLIATVIIGISNLAMWFV